MQDCAIGQVLPFEKVSRQHVAPTNFEIVPLEVRGDNRAKRGLTKPKAAFIASSSLISNRSSLVQLIRSVKHKGKQHA